MNALVKKEIALALGSILIVCLSIFWKMHPSMYVSIHGVIIALFVLFSILIWQGKAADEREEQHKAVSAEVAFTVGGAILAMAMVYQIYHHMSIDIWLVVALGGMIFSRVIARVWLEKNK